MPATTTRFLIGPVAQQIVQPDATHRVVGFVTGTAPVFIGPNNTVTWDTGLPLSGRPLPIIFPISAGEELWAIAQVAPTDPVVVFVTVDDGALTNEELRAAPLNISGSLGGSVSVSNFPAVQPVSGPLTNSELRAAPVPVSGAFFPASQPVTVMNPLPVTTARVSLSALPPASVTVGTTSVPLVAANPNRKGLVISIVTTGRTLFLGFGVPAVASSGMLINSSVVPTWTMSELTFTTDAINAISGSNGTVVGVQEFI